MSLFASSISTGKTKDGHEGYVAGDLCIILYDDYLTWEKAVLRKETANIYYSDIISVSYSNGNFVGDAHISISTAGRTYTAKMKNEYRNINIIAEAIEAKCHQVRQMSVSGVSRKSTIGSSVVEDLKLYKELLDLGIITQEEFDQKKREILG